MAQRYDRISTECGRVPVTVMFSILLSRHDAPWSTIVIGDLIAPNSDFLIATSQMCTTLSIVAANFRFSFFASSNSVNVK